MGLLMKVDLVELHTCSNSINADSALIYDKSVYDASTATIEDVVGSKIFTLTFGLNAAIQPGDTASTASDNSFMRG